MYLFQRRLPLCSVMMNVIYIPLCIYFNRYYYLFAKFFALIYIPLCIYFNKGHWFFRQRYTSIYIPLCIYFNIPEDHIFREVVSFTFHYVSISTCECINHSIYVILFTFHYVSISTLSDNPIAASPFYLHSTMYLFQLFSVSHRLSVSWYLHSTMYLFQRPRGSLSSCIFTDLHSTMYLFQPVRRWVQFPPASLFTFHYVSISTYGVAVYTTNNNTFTFHYVSISTIFELVVMLRY